MNKQCAVCAAYSTVAAEAHVLLKSCEVRYALFEVKLRASSRNRPLLWALTSGKKSLPQDEALCWAHTGRPFSHTPSHSARFRR